MVDTISLGFQWREGWQRQMGDQHDLQKGWHSALQAGDSMIEPREEHTGFAVLFEALNLTTRVAFGGE